MEDGCIIRYMKRLLKAKNSEADEKADGRPTMKKLNMWKRILLMMLIAACVFCFSACQKTEYQMAGSATQNIQVQATNAPAPVPTVNTEIDYDTYDPASEEDIGSELGGVTDLSALLDQPATVYTEPTSAPTMNSQYAGATPVVIDPIDKPTPSPVPTLTFSEYTVYDATKLSLSFEAPAGWIVNDVEQTSYQLTNPDMSVDYQATLRVSVYAVNTEYSQSEMAKEVKSILSRYRSDYNSFSPTNTATRSLLDKTGVYADYSGVNKNGQNVGGRVHVVCIGKKLYVLELTWPKAYTETYKDTVYKQFRHSVKITK